MADIAFSTARSAKGLAALVKCSPQTIRCVQCSVAWAYLQTQVIFFGRILCYIDQNKPTFAISTIMWDETSERLRRPGAEALSIAVRSTTVHIMQVRMAFCWGWEGATPADWRSCRYETVAIPMVVQSPSAENLWATFKKHSNIAELMCFRMRLLSAATYSADIKECDGASGNDKLIAHWVKVTGTSMQP
jgi:hypothetical protein